MYNIAKLNKISPAGLKKLTDNYQITEDIDNATGILVRSQDMHNMKFSPELLAIARAGTGVNNIPLEACSDKGVVVFNTPGANSNAVKELVLAGMLMAARNIPDAMNWTNSLASTDHIKEEVEQGKSHFRGHEIKGKTIGIIGLGAVGGRLANATIDLGMKVIGYDPYFNTDMALNLHPSITLADSLQEVVRGCDFVTAHVPANDSTNGMFNKELISLMKDGTDLLNFSRGSIVNQDDLLEALDSGKIHKYITDFASTEILSRPNVYCLPHLGASTSESEDNCAIMAVNELRNYLENGNIENSVNFPKVTLGPLDGDTRISVLTKGIKNPVDTVLKAYHDFEINAAAGGIKGDYGYALVSTASSFDTLPEIEGAVRVRVIR